MEKESASSLPPQPSRFVFGIFWAILFLSAFATAGPWAGFHAVLFLSVGVLMLVCPPTTRLHKSWWICAAVFLLASCGSLLPVSWFGMPAWREALEMLNVKTGSHVAVHVRQTLEQLGVFAITILVGLWLAGHHATSGQKRLWSLAFVLGVAIYAVLSRWLQDSLPVNQQSALGHFGFFPNRNHTGTYLAMGVVCGLGCVLQAIRDRSIPRISIAGVATIICLWASLGWSISRGGALCMAAGSIAWFSMLGRSYLGQNGIRAVGILFIAAAGAFFITNNRVKERLSDTVTKATELSTQETPSAVNSVEQLDFRIPTLLDTLPLIKDHAWTGIGPAQFRYIFPQYRDKTAALNDTQTLHPESDWLLLAAENGLPATIALLVLVFLAFRKSIISAVKGHDRALRTACLIAAAIVPLHGIFDVPGHRITLAWASALLFALSLRNPSTDPEFTTPAKWPFRILAMTIILSGIVAARAQWGSTSPLAMTLGENSYKEAMDTYCEDRKNIATNAVQLDSDPLENSLGSLKSAAQVLPLDTKLWQAIGFIALHFEGMENTTDHAYAVWRTLDPTWIRGPLLQADAWSKMNPQRTRVLWSIALQKTEELHRKNPQTDWNLKRVISQINATAGENAELKKIARDLTQPNP